MNETLLLGAQQVVTCRGPARARRGTEMSDLDVVPNGAVVFRGDVIVDIGRSSDLRKKYPNATLEEVDGVLFPGFVDAHTHAVFGAPRLEDHERRARGIDYKAIAEAGGGILSSVEDVRTRAKADLRDLTHRRLHTLLTHGTTTIEVKSGYGLALEHEIKQLEVVAESTQAPRLVPTFLGAHEVPLEYRSDRDAYVDVVVHEMLPEVARRKLARFCDVFCEPGVFTTDQTQRVLSEAKRYGFGLKLHADELDGCGGAELAAKLGAVSADHLAAISRRGIGALSKCNTVAVLLPGTMMFLGRPGHAPARQLIDEGAAVALATDFNPGSSPGMSLPLMATMAVSQLRMVPAETIVAITVNGAAAVGESDNVGQISPGFKADMVLASVRDWRELPYWFGVNLISKVWVAGAPCPSAPAPLNS